MSRRTAAAYGTEEYNDEAKNLCKEAINNIMAKEFSEATSERHSNCHQHAGKRDQEMLLSCATCRNPLCRGLSSINRDSLGRWDIREMQFLCSCLYSARQHAAMGEGDLFPRDFPRRYAIFLRLHGVRNHDSCGPRGKNGVSMGLLSEHKYASYVLYCTKMTARRWFLRTTECLCFYLSKFRRWCDGRTIRYFNHKLKN